MTQNRVEDGTLYGAYYDPLDTSLYAGKAFAEHLLDQVEKYVAESGDVPWLANGAKKVLGASKVFGEESHSQKEVVPRSKQMARILHHKFGVSKGDVVYFLIPSSIEMYFPVIGTWLLQGVVSPADPSLSAETVSQQLQQIGAKVIFCCKSTKNKVSEALELLGMDIPVVVMDENNDDEKEISLKFLRRSELADPYPDYPPIVQVDENEKMLICWSSGTTGKPKGILHGSKMFTKLLYDSRDKLRYGAYKTLQTTCCFHLGGFSSPLNSLIQGYEMIIIANEDLDDDIGLVTKVAAHYQVSTLLCGSHHLIQLAATKLQEGQEPVTSLGFICPLGTNVYDGIEEDLKDKFPSFTSVLNVYGQSEGGAGVSVSMTQKHLGTIMCPAVRVVNPDTGVPVGPGEVGEILYKTDCTMIGYINHEEENQRFFGQDGFCHSGDLGHYDQDTFLYFDGRLKELIKYKNYHLYPNEIEALIMQHPGVKDAAVFGRPEPSVQELVTALVVRNNSLDISEDEVKKMVDEKVDDHKKLRGGVYFVENIPRNPQGKILRKNLLKFV